MFEYGLFGNHKVVFEGLMKLKENSKDRRKK